MWRRLLAWFGIGQNEKQIVEYFAKKSTQALLQGHYGAAIRYLDRALEFQPESNRLYLAKGVIYREGLNNLAEALKCLKQATALPVRGDLENELARERARDLIREIMQSGKQENDHVQH